MKLFSFCVAKHAYLKCILGQRWLKNKWITSCQHLSNNSYCLKIIIISACSLAVEKEGLYVPVSRLLKWIRWNCSNCTMIYSFFIYRDPATICYLQFNKGPIVVSKKQVRIHWFLCQKLIATWLRLQKVELTHFPWFRGCWCQKSSSDEKERRKGLDLWETIFTTPISEKRPSTVAHFTQKKRNESVPTVQVNVILLQILREY